MEPSRKCHAFRRDLGFIIDQELNMKDHITKLCQSCYYQLRQIRTVRHSLTSSAIQTLVYAFICTRVEFSNSLLYGTSAHLLDSLQSVLNSSARLILNMIRSWLQFGVTFTSSRFCFVFDTSSTPSQATAWLSLHRITWSSYTTPRMTFQQEYNLWSSSQVQFHGHWISEGTIREKRFLRLLTTAVELTSCRHPTSPQRASTFPEETQNSL